MADDEDASEWEFETGEVATDNEADPSDEKPDEDSEWRFSLGDLEDDDEDGDDGDEQSAAGGNVFGSMSSDTEIIEPGSPELKNALFVLAGVFLAVVFFLQFYFLVG